MAIDAGFAADLLSHAVPTLTGCKRRRVWTSDEYDETRTLGEGGFGCVVRASHRCTGETVAVKKSLPSKEGKDNSTVDMLQEAVFLLMCHGHRSIVEFRAVSFDTLVDGKLSLVMEFVGPSLHDVLHEHRRGQPFTEAEVRCIMRQLLGGVKHMHGRLIVHRDIKPENILVGDGGINVKNVKICDLGLAMSMSGAPSYGKCGTRRYMAPEVLLGKPDYDGMVDMWALGCVMAELLAGKPLFDGEDDAEQLLSIFRVLGVPFFINWPEYSSLPLADKVVTPPRVRHRNRLQEHFPEDRLSKEGFEVLKGLLTCNIDKRLSATTALRRPWFTNNDDDQLELPAATLKTSLYGC